MKPILRLLLVEDSPEDADLMLHKIRHDGCEAVVERVYNAETMAAALEKQHWDIVISDYVMPGFGGLEALALFKRHELDIPFIIVSGHIGQDLAVAALKAGANDYVMKDNLERLVPAIEGSLREAALRQEKKRTTAALRESEERFRQLAENINAAFFVFEEPDENTLGRVSYVSPVYETIWSFPREPLQQDAQAWLKAIHPADRKRVHEKLPGMRHGGFNEEFRILRSDMQMRWVYFRGFPIANEQGEIRRIVCIAEDITERKYAQVQLEANAKQLHEMVEELQATEEELRTANEELLGAREELERRVEKRTAELSTANAELKRQIEERRRLENELLEIAENERRRIGFDLHDDLGQKLTGASMMVKGLENKLAAKKLPEAREMGQIYSLLNEVVDHTHDLAHYFSSLDFDGTDLIILLQRLTGKVKKLFRISCRVNVKGQLPALPANVTMQLYKIAQEAISNAIKHGKAKLVTITVANPHGKLVLTVKNDGVPFPEAQTANQRMGLRIMNYRASTIGATVEIRRNGSTGTIVTCAIPPINGTTRGSQINQIPGRSSVQRAASNGSLLLVAAPVAQTGSNPSRAAQRQR